MDQSWLQKVASALRMGGTPADPYRQYAMRAQENGETPMSREQFLLVQSRPVMAPVPQVAAPAPDAPPQQFRF